jgi:hypothetical protein
MRGHRRTLCCALLAAALPIAAAAQQLYTTVDLNIDNFVITSEGHAWSPVTPLGFFSSFHGTHRVDTSNYTNIGRMDFTATFGEATSILNPNGAPGLCYRASITATTDGLFGDPVTQGAGTATQCPVPSRPNQKTCDFGGAPADCPSPIILNLGRGGYELTGLNDPVRFDLDADGAIDVVSWTAAGERLAFLALDLNGNGVIDSGRELFGNYTLLPNGTTAPNGFEGLGQYDSNADGVINTRDSVWRRLLLWTDLDHDGYSDSGEVLPITGSDVKSVSLAYEVSDRRDRHGNLFRFKGTFRLKGDDRTCYDIYFRAAH